jgi:DNA polymerase III epsilon subunit
LNGIATGEVFHTYVNPERDMPKAAFRVHGLSAAFLADKPVFANVAADFLKFVGDARLVAHNAEFDLQFLNAELALLGIEPIARDRVIDTLALARHKFPGMANSLNALCIRFGIDKSQRGRHGALLDAEILTEVYAELNGGCQAELISDGDAPSAEIEETRLKEQETQLSIASKPTKQRSKVIIYEHVLSITLAISIIILISAVVVISYEKVGLPVESGPKNAAVSEKKENASAKYATINANKLNMRSCPSEQCDSVAKLTQGTKVKIINPGNDGWSTIERINERGQRQIGYVSNKFLK